MHQLVIKEGSINFYVCNLLITSDTFHKLTGQRRREGNITKGCEWKASSVVISAIHRTSFSGLTVMCGALVTILLFDDFCRLLKS